MKSICLVFLLLLLPLTFKAAVEKQSTPVCSTSVLLVDISEMIKSKFVGWRIKKTEDLEFHLQELWKKSKPNTCPGIASGHFLYLGRRNVAVLLVPETAEQKGYKVVILGKPDSELQTTQAIVVEDVKDHSGEDIVIYRMPPGVYSTPEDDNRIRSRFDGLQVERMEVTTIIYFWKKNHFEGLMTSD